MYSMTPGTSTFMEAHDLHTPGERVRFVGLNHLANFVIFLLTKRHAR